MWASQDALSLTTHRVGVTSRVTRHWCRWNLFSSLVTVFSTWNSCGNCLPLKPLISYHSGPVPTEPPGKTSWGLRMHVAAWLQPLQPWLTLDSQAGPPGTLYLKFLKEMSPHCSCSLSCSRRFEVPVSIKVRFHSTFFQPHILAPKYKNHKCGHHLG